MNSWAIAHPLSRLSVCLTLRGCGCARNRRQGLVRPRFRRVMMGGGSLDGIRVLELARYQAGPRGGMILSDLGAEVIKIEKLGGEETRRSEPLVRGQSVYFSVYN